MARAPRNTEPALNKELEKSSDVLYKGQTVEIRQTREFKTWLDGLRDRRARVRIDDRLKRLAGGNAGDAKSIGNGVHELRLRFGPGYRVYYKWYGVVLVLLLTGGDKGSQTRDIARAKLMAKEADDGIEDSSV